MKRRTLLWAAVFLILSSIFAFVSESGADTCTSTDRIYNFTNHCAYPVWVGATNDYAGQAALTTNWKWKLSPGDTQTACAADGTWAGRFYARGNCVFDSATIFYPTCSTNADCPTHSSVKTTCYKGVCVMQGCTATPDCVTFTGSSESICYQDPTDDISRCIIAPACATGDCNGALNCGITSGNAPLVWTEFTHGVAGKTVDNYDMSALDGIFASVEMAPIPNTYTGSCDQSGCTELSASCPYPCTWDYTSTCASELRVYSGPNVVACISPDQFCTLNPTCTSGGEACTANTDCCSGACTGSVCEAGSSLDCTKVHSVGEITCTADTDCPPLSGVPCASDASCPSGFTCNYVAGAGKNVCLSKCNTGTGKCQSIACAKDSDCVNASASIMTGQNMGCDLTVGSPTYLTCQPTNASMFGCTGTNFTSCHNTGPYGVNATWCCGGADWQVSKNPSPDPTVAYAVNPTWKSVAEPFAKVFHNACPTAYSFPYDDNPNVLNTCLGNAGGKFGYNVTFCPGSSSSLYKLTVLSGGKGSGTVTSNPAGISCGSTCMHSFASGTVITLTAVPKTGQAVDTWTGCDSTSGATCVVTMSSDKNVTVVFNQPPAIKVIPTSLDFGPVKKGASSKAKTVTIKNTGVGQLVVSGATIQESTEFSADNQCGSTPLDKGESCKVSVTVYPTAYGPRTGKLKIVTNDTKKPEFMVGLSAKAKPPVMTLSAKSFDFGKVSTTSPKTMHLTIKNTGLSDLTIDAVSTPTDTTFTVDNGTCTIGAAIAQNAKCTMDIVFTPTTTEKKTATFTITNNYAPSTPATISLSGKGK